MRYVVIGASAAGINGIRELRKLDKECEIILISKDEEIYSRCILHHYLSGHRTLSEISFVEANFVELYNVQWIKGKACTGIRPEDKVVVLEDGQEVAYDKLLIATGSCTFIPPIKNLREASNVIGFRNVKDIDRLKEITKKYKNILVIGAGLVGMDCVSGLVESERGIHVSVVEMAEWMLVKQLDQKAAKAYQDAFAERGVDQYYGTGVEEAILDANGRVTSVVLGDGTNIPCDYVVMTTGVRANIGFLEGSGLEISRTGLVFDETGKTSNDDIYGAGDVSGLSPIWPVAVKESIIAASNMVGVPRKMTDFFASKATMNFLGIPTMALGNVNPEDDSYSIEILETKDSYKKIVHKNGKIEGAILQGDLAYGGILQQLIAREIDVTKVKKPIFDIDYSDFFHTKDNFEFYFEDK